MADSREEEKQVKKDFLETLQFNNYPPLFSCPFMDNFMLQAADNNTHLHLPTTRQVSSLQDLALNCSIRDWWKTENPARHLTEQLVVIVDTLRKFRLVAHPDNIDEILEVLSLRDDGVSLISLHTDLISEQKRLETVPASLPGLAKAVPKELPLQLRNSWYMAALALLNSLVDWLLQLCQVYYFNNMQEPRDRYARFFLSRVVVKPTGEIDRARTVLNVLEDSMFHPGMIFSVCNIGIRDIDLVAAAKRVLNKLAHGAPVPQLARRTTKVEDVIKQIVLYLSNMPCARSFEPAPVQILLFVKSNTQNE